MKTTTKTQIKKAPNNEIRRGRPVGIRKKDFPTDVPKLPYLTRKSSTPKVVNANATEKQKPLNYIKWDDEKFNYDRKSNDINVKIDFSDLKESIVLILRALLFINVVLAIIIISFLIKYIL